MKEAIALKRVLYLCENPDDFHDIGEPEWISKETAPSAKMWTKPNTYWRPL